MNSFRTFLSIRKRVKQRATIFSLLVLVLLFGLFLEAYMHNFNLVYITLFFVFAAAFSAGPIGMRNLAHLHGSFAGCDRLFAGKEGSCRFQIENDASLSAWAVELRTDLASTILPELRPHTRMPAVLHFTPKKRGRLDTGPGRLQSLFPLATVRFVLPLETADSLIIYPEPKGEPLKSFLLRQRAPFGDEMDFDGLARYSGAQSASRIHWPSVAKGEIAVKTFEHELRSDTLRFEFVRCAADDESRLSQLTLWVLECERKKLPFSIIMPHAVLESKKEGIDAILEYLALF